MGQWQCNTVWVNADDHAKLCSTTAMFSAGRVQLSGSSGIAKDSPSLDAGQVLAPFFVLLPWAHPCQTFQLDAPGLDASGAQTHLQLVVGEDTMTLMDALLSDDRRFLRE